MKNVTAGTIIRTVLMLLGLINAVFSIVTTLMAWWKNNSFTHAAIEADKVMKEMKQQ